MAAARERRISLYAYNTRADAEANTNGTEYTSGIVDDTPRYEHVFFTEFPGWGETNAAMFSCDISGTTDLSDKWVRVKYSYYATDAATTMTNKWLFLGRVDSCKYDNLKTVRTLVAYDLLYYLRSVDVSDWWSTYWADKTANYYAFGTVFRDMCTAYSVPTNIHLITLPSPTINTNGAKATQLSGCSFADMLAFAGQLVGAYFYIDGAGVLQFAYIDNRSTPAAVDDNMDTANTEIGDTALPAYAAMMAYSGADVIYSAGTGEPVYTIRDNPLLNGKTTSQIATQLDELRTRLARVSGFWPLTLECIVSAPDVIDTNQDRARLLTTADGNNTRLHALGSVELWGTQLINQRAVCPADMVTGAAVSASMSAALNAIQQMGVEMTYKVNADNVIEAVNLEAQGGVTINAQAININGVVSANGNFKVDTDGNMEAANGKFSGEIEATSGSIADWLIQSGALSKVATINGVQYRASIISDPVAMPGGRYPAVLLEKNVGTAANPSWQEIQCLSYDGQIYMDGSTYPDSHIYLKMQSSNDSENTNFDMQAGEYSHAGFANIWMYANRSGSNGYASIDIMRHDSNNVSHFSSIGPETLEIDHMDILRTHLSLVGGYGTEITQGKNLNTTEFLEVRRFFCPMDATVASLTNCPTGNAFMMEVSAPIQAEIDNESAASGSRYRVRKILTWLGDMFTQACYFGSSGWVYGTWKKTPTSYTTQITTGGITWTVTQYADGYADLYADITLNGTWGSWGGMYYLQPVSTYALPITVQKKLSDVTTYVTTDGSANSALPMNYTTTANENATTCALLRPTAGNNNTNYYCRKYIRAKV